MSLKFCKFKFMQKTTPKKFYRYRITDNNPYSDKQNFKGNSVRHKIINHKENRKNRKMFIYVLDNEYLITWGKIQFIPDLGSNLKLDLVCEAEEFSLTDNNLDLYGHWIKYYVYRKIISYCSENKYSYDYTIENEYSKSLDTPKNKLNVGIKRVFKVDTEVLTDGTVYLSINIRCEYESKNNIYDLIRQKKNVIGMEVKCSWSSIIYGLQNLILGILCKSDGVPWILEKPLDDVDCFIGLDVGTQEKGIHYPACSVCLDGRGNFIGYYSTNVAQSGEKITTDSLEKIFNNVLLSYKEANGTYPEHIVIHRDGFSHEENEWYIEYFSRRNIEFDLVEIRKNTDIRLLEEEQISNDMNPSSGSAVIKGNTAYIVTTDVKSCLGAPRPLLLVHRHGKLSVTSIVRQVYILSEMHIGSMRTSRLPLTTFYADKICKHHNHVPHDIFTNKLYFL